MDKMRLDSKKIIWLLFLHPILITLYPLVRILIFGSGAATNFAELLYGFLPDLYLYSLLGLSVFNHKEKIFNKKEYSFVDHKLYHPCLVQSKHDVTKRLFFLVDYLVYML